MDNLSDDLLRDIWSRVPYKMAFRCKSISKRFFALISTPEFKSRSIYHHHTLFQHMKNDDEHEKEWYLNFVSKRKLLISFLPNIHHLSNPQNQLSLSFLGRKFDPKLDDVIRKKSVLYSRIVGCSNGLLLCKKTARGRVYHVCNPITKDWVQLPLPPPPLTGHNQHDRLREGFVCEPYYHIQGNANRVTFNRHRFRVVRFPLFDGTLSEFLSGITKSQFEIVVFSSETGEWSRKIVSCPKGFTQATVLVPAVAHGGKLYFVGKMGLLVYDPFNNDEECNTIDYPIQSPRYFPFTGHVGVSCGNIRIAHVSRTFTSPVVESVSVWELEQDSTSWSLLHVTSLPRQDLRDCIRAELQTGREGEILDMGVTVQAFHPYHGDVVFFQRAHCIFYGNIMTNQFETLGYGIRGFQTLQIISLDLPWWPTPVPSIT
ncbi:Kelch-type beta propeller [Sesbania bispinosa]|nr:Kelch-type beta propeller [Sesbania bispinosa]